MALEITDALYDEIEENLHDVVDPELDINIVDLGLVYDLSFDDDDVLIVSMTLTSAACPLTDVLEQDIRKALDGLVKDIRINWVWMPPWGPERITPEGIEQMRALGFTI